MQMAGSTLGAFCDDFGLLPCFAILKYQQNFFLLCSSEIEQVETCNLRICPLLHLGFVNFGEIHFFSLYYYLNKNVCPATGIKKTLYFKYLLFYF